jgi:lipopolysaccharide biosynthesis glycosyltransferase
LEGSIGAVADPFSRTSAERLGLAKGYIYFNAGVLVINLEKWRARNMTDRFVAFVEQRHSELRFHDQDVLNSLLHDEVRHLDMRWNFQARTRAADVVFLGIRPAEFAALAASPAIVHFTANLKPWYYRWDVPFEQDYLAYRERTPWRNFRQPDKTLLNQGIRRLRRAAPAAFKLGHAVIWRLRKHLGPKIIGQQAL